MQEKDNSIGPTVGVILILCMILLGVIYVWQQRQQELEHLQQLEKVTATENSPENMSSTTSSTQNPTETNLNTTLNPHIGTSTQK